MKTCSAVADLEHQDGIMTETDVDKAEVLNTFFTSVFTLESLETIPTFENRLHNTDLTDFLITNEEVEKILKTLKTTKPPGPDGLHPRLLVELTDQLVEPFQKIFTKSLAEGTLPQNWKEGNITPIFKKGQKHLPGNYCPVSMTSVACRCCNGLQPSWRDVANVFSLMVANHHGLPSRAAFRKEEYLGQCCFLSATLTTCLMW